jgi:hypothetical protein
MHSGNGVPVIGDTGIQIVWPDDIREFQAEFELVYPTGDYYAAKMRAAHYARLLAYALTEEPEEWVGRERLAMLVTRLRSCLAAYLLGVDWKQKDVKRLIGAGWS